MANATILYACTDEGLAIVNKPGTLTEWLPPRRVLAGEAVISAWAEPGPPTRVAAIAGDKLVVSENGGRTWQDFELAGKPVALWGQSGEGSTSVVYAAMHGGSVAKSLDGGAKWSELPPLPIDIRHARYVGNGPDGATLLMAYTLAGGGRLLVGEPESGSWQTPFTEATSDAAFDAGTGAFYALTPSGIKRSMGEGQEWDALPGAPANGYALALIPGPAGKPSTLLVGAPSGLWVSNDGVESWGKVQLPQEGEVKAFARDPERRDRIYAALSTGYLCESGNRGSSWDTINTQPLSSTIHTLHVIRI